LPGDPKIAATVVLYDPPDDVLDGINSYIKDVGVVYAIDNTVAGSARTADRVKTVQKVFYLPNGANVGIARALNMAAERAIREGYDYLLTMDQDSKARPGMVQALLACAERDQNRIAILSPVHQYLHTRECVSDEPCKEVLTTITSGNLLNLKAYQAVGPFRDDFFIDHVDDEYCLRLHLQGFKVIMANNAVLDHQLGKPSEHRLLGKQFGVSNHPPVRRYYGTRNRFYLRRRYQHHFREFFRFFYVKLLREIATVVLYERDKWKKLLMMARGYLDYRSGIIGKYRDRGSKDQRNE
jgi:rhamnosyltransferase